ncbi:hypothetical protein RISK_004252 [Rhodopirellula islandica]|uniref:Uncharacterized protein n=1 Tax=Rhodopirellula islandica TaxID=595434 RepID=A0A0J1BAW9_RHOIS|nr:hypothetical protein RISK_004252 [Rhodopirellula islandica]
MIKSLITLAAIRKEGPAALLQNPLIYAKQISNGIHCFWS